MLFQPFSTTPFEKFQEKPLNLAFEPKSVLIQCIVFFFQIQIHIFFLEKNDFAEFQAFFADFRLLRLHCLRNKSQERDLFYFIHFASSFDCSANPPTLQKWFFSDLTKYMTKGPIIYFFDGRSTARHRQEVLQLNSRR